MHMPLAGTSLGELNCIQEQVPLMSQLVRQPSFTLRAFPQLSYLKFTLRIYSYACTAFSTYICAGYSGTSSIDFPTDSPVLLSEPMPLCCLTATEQPYSSDIITASLLLYKKLLLSLTANNSVPDCQPLHRINSFLSCNYYFASLLRLWQKCHRASLGSAVG